MGKCICDNFKTLISKVNYRCNRPFKYRLINFDINILYNILSNINEDYQVYLIIDYNHKDNFNSLKVYKTSNFTNILMLNLKYDINQNINSFCNIINKVNNIKSLIFNNYLNNESIDIFNEVLKNNNSIEILDLSDNKYDNKYFNNIIEHYDH